MNGYTFIKSSLSSNIVMSRTIFDQNQYRGDMLVLKNIYSTITLRNVNFLKNMIIEGYAFNGEKILLKNCRFIDNRFGKSVTKRQDAEMYDTYFEGNSFSSLSEGTSHFAVTMKNLNITRNRINFFCLSQGNDGQLFS